MKISIITVCYNSEKTIEKTINSVLSQNFKNFEYIIIDGGSTDGTLKIIEKFKNKIHKIVSEKDNGIFDAINKGINFANGDIISVIHSDDLFFDNDVLDNVSKSFIANPNLECLIGTTLIKKIGSNSVLRKYNPDFFKKWMLYLGYSPPHPSTYIKKSVYDKYGLYKLNYQIAGDFEFFLRIFLKFNVSFKTIDEKFVIMYMGGKSTASINSNLISNREILKSFKENKIYSNWLFILVRFPIKLLQFILR